MTIYKLIMDDFSSWLLEIVKPAYQQPIDTKTLEAIIEILENNLKVLHPFMPIQQIKLAGINRKIASCSAFNSAFKVFIRH